jgi:predicted permease
MGQAVIIIRQMATLFIMMGVGYAAIKLRLITETAMDAMATYVVAIAMPAVVLSSVLGVGDRSLLFSSLSIIFIALAMLPVMGMIGYGFGKLCRLKGPTLNIHLAETLFSNSAFMGIPLVSALFGSEGLLCLAIYNFTNNFVLYTYGIGLTSVSPGRTSFKGAMKKMANPVTIAALLGFAMVMSGLKLPEVANSAVTAIGGTSSPVSMVYIGGVLTRLDFSAMLRRASILLTIPVRMILFPVVLLFVLRHTGLYPVFTETLTLIAALPPMVGVSLLAKAGGSDYVYATEYVLIGTLLSVITIPIVCWAMAMI